MLLRPEKRGTFVGEVGNAGEGEAASMHENGPSCLRLRLARTPQNQRALRDKYILIISRFSR